MAGDFIVLVLLAVVVVLSARSLWKGRKAGTCCGNCSSCSGCRKTK